MKIILEKHREFNMKNHIAFVHLNEDLDRVNRTKLLEILQNDNILQQIIQNIYNPYKTNCIAVKTEDKKSKWKVINSEVRQGCGLSPMLFTVYMNAIVKEWRQKPYGYIPGDGNLQLHVTLFADDLPLLASTEDDLRRSIYNFHILASKYNVEISIQKKNNDISLKEPVPSRFCLNNKMIERTNNFTYLGYKL
jgi:hypothetical protein